MSRQKTTPQTLTPIRSNAGVRAAYQKWLDAEIEEMHRSILYWVKAEYRKTGIAQDATPAAMMVEAMRRLARRWRDHFDDVAAEMAKRFADRVLRNSDAALQASLAQKDIPTVRFTMSEPMRNAMQAVTAGNVNLIKSIAEQHLTQVETLVMQSVERGRDVGTLQMKLVEQFGVTRRRAATIARDQNNKATAIMQTARQQGLGITEGIWKHSHAGKTPRPSHLKANNQRFNLKQGLYLDGEWVLPGEAINCRCTWAPILPWIDD